MRFEKTYGALEGRPTVTLWLHIAGRSFALTWCEA
jgi:hypothetical protein